MKRNLKLYLTNLVVFLLLSTGWKVASGNSFPGIERRKTPVVRVVQKVSPSVVNISTQQIIQRRISPFGEIGGSFFDSFFKDFPTPGFIQRFKLKTLGSGIVFGDGTEVLTNHHVINQAQEISVITNKGKRIPATLVGSDEVTDIAVLRIKGKASLPSIPLGTSSDLMIGETAIAIGNPFGLSNTVTVGVISSLHRSLNSEGSIYKDLIQTDASINPGNSGGPLLNILGKVIGINTAIYSHAQGIGFAIPIDRVKKISSAIMKYGSVPPVWFGIDCQALTPSIARHFRFKGDKGILVTAVEIGSPAYKSHLKVGDIISAINQSSVFSPLVFQQILNQYMPGDHITLSVARNGVIQKVSVVLKRLTLGHGAFIVRRIFGFGLRNLNNKEKKLLSKSELSGIAISEIIPRSIASSNGLRNGDILLQLNDTPLKDVKTFRKVLYENLRKGSFELVLLRGSYTYKLVFNIYNSNIGGKDDR